MFLDSKDSAVPQSCSGMLHAGEDCLGANRLKNISSELSQTTKERTEPNLGKCERF